MMMRDIGIHCFERMSQMIKVILWDIDGTLLNFKQSESYAVRKCFSVFGLGECTDEMLARYSVINSRYWRRLEAGELTKEEVLQGRFAEFFRSEGIPCEKIREFNDEYQIRLGDKIFFNDNGYQIIQRLKGHVKQYAVTNGTYTAQKRKLEKSGLDMLFDGVFISDQIGIEKPNIGFFEHVWEQIGEYRKEEVLIVGDSLTSDMQGGNNAGILCCWYHPNGPENTGNLKIDYTISDLHQVESVILS